MFSIASKYTTTLPCSTKLMLNSSKLSRITCRSAPRAHVSRYTNPTTPISTRCARKYADKLYCAAAIPTLSKLAVIEYRKAAVSTIAGAAFGELIAAFHRIDSCRMQLFRCREGSCKSRATRTAAGLPGFSFDALAWLSQLLLLLLLLLSLALPLTVLAPAK
jgi:hypothetical protein